MKTYDVRCPICGAMNKNVYLDDTDGWIECDHCGEVTKSYEKMPLRVAPLYTMEQLLRRMASAG